VERELGVGPCQQTVQLAATITAEKTLRILE
jgi:hypothetical protein